MSIDKEEAYIKWCDEKFTTKRAERLEKIGLKRIQSMITPGIIDELNQINTDNDIDKFSIKFISSKYLWEAYICYVYGYYEASIIMCGASIEATLVVELKNVNIDPGWKTLGRLMGLCKQENIIPEPPEPIEEYIQDVKDARNDLIHFKPKFEEEGVSVEGFSALFVGDVPTATTSKIVEDEARRKVEELLKKTQIVIDYFSKNDSNVSSP